MILIIDDDPAIRSSLTFLLKRANYPVTAAANPQEALDVVRHTPLELVLMDMNYSHCTTGEEGLELLQKLRIFNAQVPVILITAWGSIELAVKGMQAGAFDFITKPWNNFALLQRIETALQIHEKNSPKTTATDELAHFDRSPIIGQSQPLKEVLNTLSQVADTNAAVLITGESGTGKELIAEALHRNSKRANRPFVKVNLGGISQSLFESEMFGHKKGSFTGAVADRIGRFEMANGGTIFLDEIGELDLSCQVKLLRVLQEQTFEVLGDSKPRRIDVRVVCATNADLPRMIADKEFREDLFYRINLITVHLPPLRERREDIPLLAAHFAEQVATLNGIPCAKCSPGALTYLASLPFYGNIRELKNLVERTQLVSRKEQLEADDFRCHQSAAQAVTGSPSMGQQMTLEELERHTILQALEQYENNLTHVARTLGISRAALYRRLEKYGIAIHE